MDIALEDAIERLDRVIKASEDWAKSYEKNPDVLAKLIRREAKLERNLRKYFKLFASERLPNIINWQMYQAKAIKAYSYDVMVDVEEIDDEEFSLIQKVLYEPLQLNLALGAETAEEVYKIDLGLNQYSKAVMEATDKYVANLVKNVNNTTKDRIKQSIQTSINLGEDIQTAIERLQSVISDPRRAELIARTESVRSYNMGIRVFGQESNATRFYWELSSDPCEICVSEFNANGGEDGVEFDRAGDPPPAHPNCRCGSSLAHDYGE